MRCVVTMLLSVIIACGKLCAQNYAQYNSYYLNPALYNPAEVLTNYTYLFVNHRQQWMNIEGAPMLTTVNLHTRFDESRAGFGIKASSFKRGILTTTDFLATYGYSVPLNKTNAIHFGLSGGAITNSIDLTESDGTDPAIANYLANNIQPAASFGFMFKSKSGLNFGVALPQLLVPRFNSAANFENTNISPIDNVVASMYFRRKVEGRVVTRKVRGVRRRVKTDDAYAPLELYAMYKYEAAGNNQFEVMGKVNLSQNFWLGASYRQSYGLAGSLGIMADRFTLAYSYEPGNQPVPAFSQGSHEIQIGLRLGQEKSAERPMPELRSLMKAPSEQRHSARFQHQDDPAALEGQEKASKKRYYVVVRSYNDFAAADAYMKDLSKQKYNAQIFYYSVDKKYHVYVFGTTKAGEASQEVRNLKNYTKLKQARVLTVEE